MLESTITLCLIIIVGVCLRLSGFVSVGFAAEVNCFVHKIGLPVLIIAQLTGAEGNMYMIGRNVSVMALVTLLTFLAAYGLAQMLRMRAPECLIFVQESFGGNIVFVGLSLVYVMPNADLGGGTELHRAATLSVAPVVLLYNILAYGLLRLCNDTTNAGKMTVGGGGYPLMLSFATVVLGLVFTALELAMPRVVIHGAGMLAEMVMPFGLLAFGMSLCETRSPYGIDAAVLAAFTKVVVAPLLAITACALFSLDAPSAKAVLLMMAVPASIIMWNVKICSREQGFSGSLTVLYGALMSITVNAYILVYV